MKGKDSLKCCIMVTIGIIIVIMFIISMRYAQVKEIPFEYIVYAYAIVSIIYSFIAIVIVLSDQYFSDYALKGMDWIKRYDAWWLQDNHKWCMAHDKLYKDCFNEQE